MMYPVVRLRPSDRANEDEALSVYPFPSTLGDLTYQLDWSLQEPPEPLQPWFSPCYPSSYIPYSQNHHQAHV